MAAVVREDDFARVNEDGMACWSRWHLYCWLFLLVSDRSSWTSACQAQVEGPCRRLGSLARSGSALVMAADPRYMSWIDGVGVFLMNCSWDGMRMPGMAKVGCFALPP